MVMKVARAFKRSSTDVAYGFSIGMRPAVGVERLLMFQGLATNVTNKWFTCSFFSIFCILTRIPEKISNFYHCLLPTSFA